MKRWQKLYSTTSWWTNVIWSQNVTEKGRLRNIWIRFLEDSALHVLKPSPAAALLLRLRLDTKPLLRTGAQNFGMPTLLTKTLDCKTFGIWRRFAFVRQWRHHNVAHCQNIHSVQSMLKNFEKIIKWPQPTHTSTLLLGSCQPAI